MARQRGHFDLGTVSRRDWLRTVAVSVGGFVPGSLGPWENRGWAQTSGAEGDAAKPRMPSKQTSTSCDNCYCPWGLTGMGGGMWYYYCRHCPTDNGYYPGAAYPSQLPQVATCDSGYCIPGGTMAPMMAPIPSKQLPPIPSKQMPVAAPRVASTVATRLPGDPPPFCFEDGLKKTGLKSPPSPGFPFQPVQGVSRLKGRRNVRVLASDVTLGICLIQLDVYPKGMNNPPVTMTFGLQLDQYAPGWPLASLTPFQDRIVTVSDQGVDYSVILAPPASKVAS